MDGCSQQFKEFEEYWRMYGYLNDSDDLSRLVKNLDLGQDIYQVRKVLKRILIASAAGVNTENLFPDVVKLLASTDLATKKLVCWFVSRHCGNQDHVLLAVNTLVKECRDSNPVIRGISLRTLTSIPHPFMLDYSLPVSIEGLSDSSAYVRRIAVLSCAKLYHVNAEVILEQGVVNRLYGMIRDSDPVVVVNSLVTLDEILATEGGIVINHKIAIYLLNKLQMFTEYGLSIVVTFLSKYTPQANNESLEIMNILDGHLKSSNALLLVQTIQLFRHLIREMPHLEKDIVSRAKDTILNLISSENSELAFVLLEYVETLMKDFSHVFQTHHRTFFCRYNDPVYMKIKKINLLPYLAFDSNLQELLEELTMYCSEVLSQVSICAVNALGEIARKFPSNLTQSVDTLLGLLDARNEFIIHEVLLGLQSLQLRQLPVEGIVQVLNSVEKCAEIVEDDAARSCIVWFMGEYGEHLDESPYILERYIEDPDAQLSNVMLESLLTAGLKLFLKRPGECQDILGQILEKCYHSGDVDLQYRVRFYYKLLRSDVNLVKQFVLGDS